MRLVVCYSLIWGLFLFYLFFKYFFLVLDWSFNLFIDLMVYVKEIFWNLRLLFFLHFYFWRIFLYQLIFFLRYMNGVQVIEFQLDVTLFWNDFQMSFLQYDSLRFLYYWNTHICRLNLNNCIFYPLDRCFPLYYRNWLNLLKFLIITNIRVFNVRKTYHNYFNRVYK